MSENFVYVLFYVLLSVEWVSGSQRKLRFRFRNLSLKDTVRTGPPVTPVTRGCSCCITSSKRWQEALARAAHSVIRAILFWSEIVPSQTVTKLSFVGRRATVSLLHRRTRALMVNPHF
jgi:hypothetical protein